MNLYKKFMLWYWTRHYLKLLTTDPNSAEASEMAQKTGRVRELWKLQRTPKSKEEKS